MTCFSASAPPLGPGLSLGEGIKGLGLILIILGYIPVTRFSPAWLVDGIAAFSFMAHFDALRAKVAP